MARTDLERFCEVAYPRLVAALAHQTGDRWLAEELAQEALIRACDHWDARVAQLESPLAWTFRVGANLANSHFRRIRAERRARARHGVCREQTQDLADAADALAVRSALAALTPQQREVVVMRYFLGLSAAEVGAATKMSAGAVRVLAHRAVNALRAVLDVDDHEEEISGAS